MQETQDTASTTTIEEDDLPESEGLSHDHDTAVGRMKFFNDLCRRLYLRVNSEQFVDPIPAEYRKTREAIGGSKFKILSKSNNINVIQLQ